MHKDKKITNFKTTRGKKEKPEKSIDAFPDTHAYTVTYV